MQTARDLHEVLDELAGLVAEVDQADPRRHVVAAVVTDLERIASAPLTGRDEPLAVLVRRFARAQALLLCLPEVHADSVPRLRRHARILRDPLEGLLAVWNDWQNLRAADGSLLARFDAREAVDRARAAVRG